MQDTARSDAGSAASSGVTSPNGNGKEIPFNTEHAINTFLGTVPVAAVYLSSKDLQRSVLGNALPVLPAAVAEIEAFNNDEKAVGKQVLADLLIAVAPLLLSRAFK